jgi:hypothetical protein
MQKLKDLFFSYRNQQAGKNNSAVRRTVEYSQAKSVGVLFSDDEYLYPAVSLLMKRLLDDGKRVKALMYFKTYTSTPFDFTYDYFTNEHLTATGLIKHDRVDRFIETEFDYLFCVNRQPFAPFDSIMLRSVARCRVGMYQEDKTAGYELMLVYRENESAEVWVNQLFHYLHALTLHNGNKI